VSAGFPTRVPITAAGRAEADSLPGGPTASLLYRGDYAGIAAVYDAALEWLSDHEYREAGQPWSLISTVRRLRSQEQSCASHVLLNQVTRREAAIADAG
jgi:effector-binding domain-containing protein